MNTYGFHSIHGRAPTIASGLKAARPELSVWVITGDGDALSIGGNHFLHVLRRNMDLQIILHNNEVYGLTKGQYSPTSPCRHRQGSRRPMGSHRLAAAAAGRRAGRRGDVRRALARRRPAPHGRDARRRRTTTRAPRFVEIYQNCNIYNDGAFEDFTAKDVRADRMLYLKHGEPMIFGKNHDKGIRLNGLKPEVVEMGKDGITEADILVHDETHRGPDHRLHAHAHGLPGVPGAGRRHPRRPAPDLQRPA